MESSDGMSKPWDHPWTTDEMRQNRREWSLAGDAGLLKHLQQFSENIVSKANKTQEAINSLSTQLSETAILIDNVTNTSLALANTQFIESRVQEDDVEIQKAEDLSQKDEKSRDSATADLIASVSESVKGGLSLMEERYHNMEIVDSDSEDETNSGMLSVVLLGAKNPYQDRPLPYVIGSEKWHASNKIGLESSSSSSSSSSSESEQLGEEEEEEELNKESKVSQQIFNANNHLDSRIARLSSSSSDVDNYSGHNNNIMYVNNGKSDALSQNTEDFASSSITPSSDTLKTNASVKTPNFAEELAKRLGNVRQDQKPIAEESSEASINRINDDLFLPEEDEDIFSNKSEDLFKGNRKGLFNDEEETSAKLWNDKPTARTFKSKNIIPASNDVPPPINTVSVQPKSAIDDLFGDIESEDSDDIFSSKSSVKKIITKDNSPVKSTTENSSQKHLNVNSSATRSMITSTPEVNTNYTNLFSDEEDEDDLFGNSKKYSNKQSLEPSSVSQDTNKKKPIGGVSVFGKALASDIENKLSSRLMQRRLSSSSSEASSAFQDDTSRNHEHSNANERMVHIENSGVSQDNFSHNNINNDDSVVAGNVQNSMINTQNSSGVSVRAASNNVTTGSMLEADFEPSVASTRLKSEEIYRERVVSDSLFTARSLEEDNNHHSNRTNVNSTTSNNNAEQQQAAGPNQSQLESNDDVFDNDDLFGPPPLPKSTKAANKNNTGKSNQNKLSSLFDDSEDSGDELLFSGTSSVGSRSQKSTDLLNTASQNRNKNFFDEDIDIFSTKDSPDVDIFGTQKENAKPEGLFSAPDIVKSTNKSIVDRLKTISLFDDDEVEVERKEDDTTKVGKKEEENDDDDDDDDDDDTSLFSSNKKKVEIEKMKADEDLFTANREETRSIEPGMAGIGNSSSQNDAQDNKKEKKMSGNGLFTTALSSHGLLFEDDEEDYDDEDLFGDREKKNKKKTKNEEEEEKERKIEGNESTVESVKTKNNEQESSNEGKRNKKPPQTLNLKNSGEESSQTPAATRRAVSGKIKNLMGKMGDLKILSPTDAIPWSTRSEKKSDEVDEPVAADKDSDDGGSISKSRSPPSVSEDSTSQILQSQSSVSERSNMEVAISFDEPAPVEILRATASKNRVRIQAKRRPQSRHARKSALRHSGIDFDTVDLGRKDSHEESDTNSENNSNKVDFRTTKTTTISVHSTSERVTEHAESSNVSIITDDRSEYSKESCSISTNKNTLLSPSTDEEDLFDVPPDLPEDPQKEDTLFGRAPLLSPVQNVFSKRGGSHHHRSLRDTIIGGNDNKIDKKKKKNEIGSYDKKKYEESEENDTATVTTVDPLHDDDHDALKDPSRLFAFVTKTPSPEKGRNALFNEDDSLFTNNKATPQVQQKQKKHIEEHSKIEKKEQDLFGEDTTVEDDLFSAASLKKSIKDTKKVNLFDDGDEEADNDDSLFGAVGKTVPVSNSQKKIHLFEEDDDEDTNLFAEASSMDSTTEVTAAAAETTSKKLTNIFEDQSSGEDDLFGSKKTVISNKKSKSLFLDNEDEDDEKDEDIFGKSRSTVLSKSSTTTEHESRNESTNIVKKSSVTRDLKKTAETIVEDPLSLLKDD